MLRGQGEVWTREVLLAAIKCDHGYTASSSTVQHFVDVLCEMSVTEQRSLLRFVTGSPRLPPGGVAALRPQLTIVMKRTSTGAPLLLSSLLPAAIVPPSLRPGCHCLSKDLGLARTTPRP